MKYQLDTEQILSLRRIFLSFLISVLLTTTYTYLDNQQQKNNFIFAITTLAATTTGFSALSAFRSIKGNLESQKLDRKQEAESQVIERTLSYIRRWNDLQFLPVKRVAQELYKLVEEQTEERENFLIKRLEDNRNEREDITNLLNFFEEMSICVEEKIVQEELLIKFFKGIVNDYCKTYYCYIQYRRQKRNNERIYKYLTNLHERWNP